MFSYVDLARFNIHVPTNASADCEAGRFSPWATRLTPARQNMRTADNIGLRHTERIVTSRVSCFDGRVTPSLSQPLALGGWAEAADRHRDEDPGRGDVDEHTQVAEP